MRKIYLLLLSFVAVAAQAQTLTLDSCVSLALENNKTLQASRKLVEKYGYEVKAYRANFFPNFSLSGNGIYSDAEGSFSLAGGYLPSYSFNAQTGSLVPNVLTDASGNVVMNGTTPVFSSYAYFPGADLKLKVGTVWHAGINVEQPIYMGGKIVTAYKMSKRGREMSSYGEQLTRNQVIVSVQEAYSLLVRANEMYKVAVQYDSLLASLQTDVCNAEKRGIRSHNDVLKVQVKAGEARLQVRQAENGQRLAAMNLCHCIGLPLTSAIEVDPESIALQTDQFTEGTADISSRPEYKALDLQSQLASDKVKLERSEYLPQIGLAGTYSYVDGLEINGTKLFDKTSFGVVLNVKVPLYHANEGHNKIKAAKLEAERATLDQQDKVEQMNLELAQASNNLDEARLEVDLAEESLAQAEDNLKSSRSSYDRGLESLSDLMEAQTLWQQAYAKLVDARSNLFVASTKYRKASGTL